MKKIVALALVIVMVLGLMAGCGEKPMDAATLVKKIDEATKNTTAMAFNMGMEFDLSIAVTGMTLDMGFDMDMVMEYNLDMSAMHTAGTMTIEAMGMNEETGIESYMVKEGDKLISYTYSPEGELWMKTEEDLAEMQSSQEAMMDLALKFDDIPAEKMSLAEAQETVDGKSCYVLTVNIDGAMMQESFGGIMSILGGEEMEGLDLSALEDTDLSALNMVAVYYVDAATFCPVQIKMDIQGLGEVMNEVLGGLMGALLAGDESMELTIDVPKCAVTMTEMKYNDVQVPAVPQDALDNAMTEEEWLNWEEDWEDDGEEYEYEFGNPAQADGSFLMEGNNATVRIVIPAGYEVSMSEYGMLFSMSEDYNTNVSYMLLEGYTVQEIVDEYDYLVQVTTEEERWESGEIIENVNGFTVGTIVTNDGMFEFSAWLEVSGGVMQVTGTGFEDMPDYAEILANIELVG